jgi:SRSO17 transposase
MMTAKELKAVRKRLERFLTDLTMLMGRSERRHWAEVYIRGLLLDSPVRKTATGMARSMEDANEQALQQMLSASPWEQDTVRGALAVRMSREIVPQPAWIIDDTGFPKQGEHSVGVARQYSGTLGKVGNCQVMVSLHLSTDEASVPLDFALYLPEKWTNNPERMRAAKVPEYVVFREKWRLALELIDRALGWGVPPGVVIADSAYGDVTEFREELASRKLPYMVQVSSGLKGWSMPVKPQLRKATSRRGRPPRRYDYSEAPVPQTVKEVALALPTSTWKMVLWREGSRGKMSSRFTAVRFQPSHGHTQGDAPQPEQWLIIEWPQDQETPIRYWLSDLPQDYGLRRLVRDAKARWRIEIDYRELKDELGLDHYEGRSWIGWNHHVTLTMMAHAFLTMERLRNKKNFWVGLPEDVQPSGSPERTATAPVNLDRPL